ncbi:MAG TPA: hypothetical protein QGH03_01705 [Candidatus Paceibacterota bacterium]|nr:hypothetical protein [Candidatus Paceibacterota bacterium]
MTLIYKAITKSNTSTDSSIDPARNRSEELALLPTLLVRSFLFR